jgi:hypothetical protein
MKITDRPEVKILNKHALTEMIRKRRYYPKIFQDGLERFLHGVKRVMLVSLLGFHKYPNNTLSHQSECGNNFRMLAGYHVDCLEMKQPRLFSQTTLTEH